MNDEKILMEAIPMCNKESIESAAFSRFAFGNYVQEIRSSCVDCESSECMKYLSEGQNLYHLRDIWSFLNADDLYETVDASSVPMDWFAFSTVCYVYELAGFTAKEKDTLISKFNEWLKEKNVDRQQYFNLFMRMSLDKLRVSYG